MMRDKIMQERWPSSVRIAQRGISSKMEALLLDECVADVVSICSGGQAAVMCLLQ